MLISSGVLMLLFQNCGQQHIFSAADGALVTKSYLSTSGDQVTTQVEDEEDQMTEVASNGSSSQARPPKEVRSEGSCSEHEATVDREVASDDSEALDYVCVLAGPGKSQLLGFLAEHLVSQNSTPDTVCTSKSACLDIVSEFFEVKGVEKRGYCGQRGNPHVVRLNSEKISLLMSK